CHRRGTHLRRLSRRRARHDRPPHLRRPHPARRVPAARARGPTPRADCLRPSACAGFRRSGGRRRAFRGRSGWSTAAWLAAPANQRLKLPSAEEELMAEPRITGIEVHTYTYTLDNLGKDYNGFNLVYQQGSTVKQTGHIIRILTDAGLVGEYAGGSAADYAILPSFAHYLIGKNALERERIYADVKRALRQVARIGLAPVDIALWDLAGKYYETPIYRLLGGYKDRLPCQASTYHGDTNGGLDSPEAYAEFALQCREIRYPAVKIHGLGQAPVAQGAATVQTVRRQVGDRMDVMLDPACEYITFGDALKVGWACDEARYFWYEDPYRDGGISQFAHRKLRQLIKTPLLMTEHVRTLEL